MSALDIIRAWKDTDYRLSLSAEQLAQLPENPVGQPELTDEELKTVAGGATPALTKPCGTAACCDTYYRCW